MAYVDELFDMIERHERKGEGSIVTKSEINTLLRNKDDSFFSTHDYYFRTLGVAALFFGLPLLLVLFFTR